MSRLLCPTVGASTVTTNAVYPAASARRINLSVFSLSACTYICNHRGAPNIRVLIGGASGAIGGNVVVAVEGVEGVEGVAAAAAAAAAASVAASAAAATSSNVSLPSLCYSESSECAHVSIYIPEQRATSREDTGGGHWWRTLVEDTGGGSVDPIIRVLDLTKSAFRTKAPFGWSWLLQHLWQCRLPRPRAQDPPGQRPR